MRLLLLLLLLHYCADSLRVVVTFQSAEDRLRAVPPPEASLLKSFGRRHVLLLTENNASQIAEAYAPLAVVSVEEDLPVLSSGQVASAAAKLGVAALENYTATRNATVAVLDTGFPRYVVGYDFVSDTEISGDGDARDPDASDPGDTACSPSWHGAKMANLVREVAPQATLASVRVLGACSSGYASDVADGIVWASGGAILGLGTIASQAQVISMSLVGRGQQCPSYLQSAVSQALALGSVLFAAAGNEGRDLKDYFPANCVGVQPVGATTTADDMIAPYSNWGPTAVYAPGDVTVLVDNGTATWEEQGTGTSVATALAAGLAARFVLLGVPVRLLQPREWTRGIGILDAAKAVAWLNSNKNVTYAEANATDDEWVGFLDSQVQAAANWYARSCPADYFVTSVSLWYGGNCGGTTDIMMTCTQKWVGTAYPALFLTYATGGSATGNAMVSSQGFDSLKYCGDNNGHTQSTYFYIGATGYTPGALSSWPNTGARCSPDVYRTCGGTFVSGLQYLGVDNTGTCIDGLNVVCGGITCSTSCPANTYMSDSTCNVQRDRVCTACADCPAGQYRVNCAGTSGGTCTPCDTTACGAGYYRSGCDTLSGGTCTACDTTTCGAGNYRSGCGALSGGTCTACDTTTCGAGNYRSGCGALSGGTCTACGTCPAGQYRTSCSGLSAGSCATCAAGSWKSTTDTATSCTAVGSCTSGTYKSTTTGCTTWDCVCPACAQTKYCPAGSTAQNPCAAGSVCTTPNTQVACLAGYYCPAGSTVMTPCPAGRYCPASAAAATVCTAGSYCPQGSAAGTPCPAGSYCPAGSTAGTPCPAGTYSSAVSATASCPTACTGSYYCPAGSTAQAVCPGGLFCAAGIGKVCPAGSYCPAGSSAPTACQAGYTCGVGLAAQPLCPTGKVGAQCSTTCSDLVVGNNCAACSSGKTPTSSSSCAPCPAGTYEDHAVCRACDTGASYSIEGSPSCAYFGVPTVAALVTGQATTCATWTSDNGTASSSVACWGENIGTPPPGVPKAVAVGNSFACALLANTSVACWGNRNDYGQLGAVPANVTAIAAGLDHACALLRNGSVACWGRNDKGQLGTANITNITAIAAGFEFTCALSAPSYVYCWGDNAFGQLGVGSTQNVGDDPGDNMRTPVKLPFFDIQAIACGGAHACALSAYGTVACWGYNLQGQLGIATADTSIGDEPQDTITKALLLETSTATAVACGAYHTCVLYNTGDMSCWGYNNEGQLGVRLSRTSTGTNGWGLDMQLLVSVLPAGLKAIAITCGTTSTCAILTNRSAACWGLLLGTNNTIGKGPTDIANVLLLPTRGGQGLGWNGTGFTQCATGTYNPGGGGPLCTPCPAGSYSAATAASACTACAAGYYAAAAGSTTCQKCEPGTYANAQGAAFCFPCLPGSFATALGATA